MKKILSLTILSLTLILSACAKDSGERTPIKNAGGKDGKQAGKSSFKPTSKSSKDGKKCLNLDDLINNKLKGLNQADLRVYVSDLRVLEENTLVSNNQSTMEKPDWAQSNLVIEKVQEDLDTQLPFIEVNYAKNIIKDVPSVLAPFKIIEKSQQDCLKLEAKFYDGNSSQKDYEIVTSDSNEFQIVLKSLDKNELYIFRLFGDNQMQFISFRYERERMDCKKDSSEKDVLTRTILTYEWNYNDSKKIEISTVLADSLRNILSNKKDKLKGKNDLPVDFFNTLANAQVSDTSRINIRTDDYRRILDDIRARKITPQCR